MRKQTPVKQMKHDTCLLAWTMIALVFTALPSLAQSAYEPYTFTTLAGIAGHGSVDGTGSAARFYNPGGTAVDSEGNIYVADFGNATIRKVTPAGVVTTLAGLAGSPGSADGTGSATRFNQPYGVAVDSGGNVYVADTLNYTIRKVTATGVVTTLAGLAGSYGSADGTGSAARFGSSYGGPRGVAVDSGGNLYVADTFNYTIRKVSPAGAVTTIAGLAQIGSNGFPGYGNADGTKNAARFGNDFGGPSGVAVDNAGNVYVADTSNHTIRKVTPAGVVTTLAGWGQGSADGTGSDVGFFNPTGVAVDSAGNVYVADSGNSTIRKGYPAPSRFVLFGSRWGIDGGKLGFFLTGPAGQSVVVEASADLVSWLPVWTNTFAGAIIFSDPQSGVYSNRFYRAHLP